MSEKLRPHYASTRGTIIEKPGVGILVAAGAGAPTASAPGYAKGCLFIDHTNGVQYVNTGSSTSATWAAVSHA